tara:strand:+ start:160 stop:759 length:600 start_codon:yes stop_codon:yes gene_type:complete
MSGRKSSKEKLNFSLLKIANILNNNNFDKWFIVYGTLLGIVRNNSCIDGDDDIDIMCDINDYQKLKDILDKEGFEFDYGYGINQSKFIIKTKESSDLVSIDFYMAIADKKGNFNDMWEKVIWSNCYIKDTEKFLKINWQNTTLNLPNNYFKKIRKRYGFFWRMPQKKNTKYKKNRTKLKSFIKKSFLYNFVKVRDSSKI